jgi:hypothetical protein
MLASMWCLPASASLGFVCTSAAGIPLRWETGPPPRPSGREALALHATLVI